MLSMGRVNKISNDGNLQFIDDYGFIIHYHLLSDAAGLEEDVEYYLHGGGSVLGWVELSLDTHRGLICVRRDNEWLNSHAYVLCKSMGFSGGIASHVKNANYKMDDMPVWISLQPAKCTQERLLGCRSGSHGWLYTICPTKSATNKAFALCYDNEASRNYSNGNAATHEQGKFGFQRGTH